MRRVIAALSGIFLLASCSLGSKGAILEAPELAQDVVLDTSSPASAALSAAQHTLAHAQVAILASAAQEASASEVAEEYGIPVLVADAELDTETGDELARLGVRTLLLADAAAPKNWRGHTEDIAEVKSIVRQFDDPQHQEFPVIADVDFPAARATLQVAGGQIMASPADPRGDVQVIKNLTGKSAAVALMKDANPQLAMMLATARAGKELPGGGQLVFQGKRYVALYGSPLTPLLGVLGEQSMPETIARAAQLAAEFQPLTDDTVVPALEIIVTVAAGGAGDDGNYSDEYPIETFRPMIEAAAQAGQYVVLDLQPGRTDFLTQVKQYEELLKYPNVGLALDPEWRLGPDQLPLRQIGHVEIAEVNSVVTYLADLVKENQLPQKMLVLHQFQIQMIRGIDQLDQSRAELAVMVHVDGHGTQPAKWGTWSALLNNSPNISYWGWKNFIDEDAPMLNPAQTYEVKPQPNFVSYQ